ncbi:TonB-dependent receptor [Luteibacter sp. SG786]|uniref:TonB-dependent receptor n=1 Tax=Luteibacter sp. SG786 TaxID=2587130 RepID=UPI00141E315B|nr:TonB-dependent receptor [Luteibacter sp. SG786]NII55866.1 outer membrane receptor for ferrienterochelin and colicin [Luteibacter sp. SG786]
MSSRSIRQASVLRRSSLALALAMGMGLTGSVFAQATTGSLFGSAQPGETVQITSQTGVTRSTTVGENGRYTFGNLPLGSYKVSLMKDGATVDSRDNVELRVNAGTEVSFTAPAAAANASNLEGVTVVGTALPPIDVSSVDSRTVITQTQLKQLPLGRSAEAIALLAPGVTAGATGTGIASPTGQGLISFAGSSVNENAYYVNGMNTTDPINGYGGIVLPYGAIDQQEILTGGYGAQYGRSAGGVINVVGRRGTNDFHFGGQLLFTPKWAKADPRNINYPKGSADQGDLYQYRRDNKDWEAVASAYAGGPLIKDKLFAFVAVEGARREGTNVGSVPTTQVTNYRYDDPKLYGKIDWNINDNNILELTGASYKDEYSGGIYGYDNDTKTRQEYRNAATIENTKQTMWLAKYTSYITDTLTLTAQYGKQKTAFYTQPALTDPDLIYITTPGNQNPALNGGVAGGIGNAQNLRDIDNPKHESKGTNYRLDLSWVVGNHTLSAGIDNQNTQDNDDGSYIYGNAGYSWAYGRVSDSGTIAGGLVDPLPGQTYYVSQYRITTSGSVRVKQRAQYVEDKWQVTDNILLSLGLRNDQFTNYNAGGQAYITQTKPQWAPRLGGTWDVYGDSTFKVYANAGRYYLALPASPALRAASGSYYTNRYFAYSGIDPATGYPTGLTPLNTVRGLGAEVSTNNEYGQQPDPKTVTAKGVKAEYQDEFIAGFDKTLGTNWTYGAKLTYRKLGNAIDDYCDSGRVQDAFTAAGYDTSTQNWDAIGCYLFNPGRANTFQVQNAAGGYDSISLSNKDLGFPHLKRHYYAAELHLDRQKGDGNWWGTVSYTYSRLYGNSEGQVDTDAGTRSNPSVTQAWDNAPLMVYSNGDLANDHTHALKAYGAYQITPEWMVAGNIAIVSGAPRNCYGGFGPDEVDAGYGVESYHWCAGQPSPPGKGSRLPMTHTVSVSSEYRPAFADHKLAFSVEVFNLFNEQQKTQSYPYYGVSNAPNEQYRRALTYQTPRSVRFGVTYDY